MAYSPFQLPHDQRKIWEKITKITLKKKEQKLVCCLHKNPKELIPKTTSTTKTKTQHLKRRQSTSIH